MSNVPTTALPPEQAGKFAVLLDALDRRSAVQRPSGPPWPGGFDKKKRGDHPRPADPIAEASDLPTTGDLAENCR